MKKFLIICVCLFGMIFSLSAESSSDNVEKQFYEDVITFAEFKTDCVRVLWEDPCEITRLFFNPTKILESKSPYEMIVEKFNYIKEKLKRYNNAEFEEDLQKIDLLKEKYDYNNLMARLWNASANNDDLRF